LLLESFLTISFRERGTAGDPDKVLVEQVVEV